MAECKHKFQTTGTILCKECGIDLVDYLNSQNEQYEATKAAMRGALEVCRDSIDEYLEPEVVPAIDNALSTTAGEKLLEKIERLERENKTMRNCANCNHSEFGYEGPECKLDCRRSYECEDNDLKYWQIAERLVGKQ